MTWTRLSDDATQGPAITRCSRDARYLHVEALVWSNRHETDGRVPRHQLRWITDSPTPEESVAELVGAGKWVETEDGWQLDWADQETAATIRERRAKHAEVERRSSATRRARAEAHAAGDHRLCSPQYCSALRSDRSADRHPDQSGDESLRSSLTGTRPDPSRPDPLGEGEGAGERIGSPNGSPTAPQGKGRHCRIDLAADWQGIEIGWTAELRNEHKRLRCKGTCGRCSLTFTDDGSALKAAILPAGFRAAEEALRRQREEARADA